MTKTQNQKIHIYNDIKGKYWAVFISCSEGLFEKIMKSKVNKSLLWRRFCSDGGVCQRSAYIPTVYSVRRGSTALTAAQVTNNNIAPIS